MTSKSPITNIKKHLKIEMHFGRTDIYLFIGNESDKKLFVKFNNSVPLSPCVIDNSCFCYVFFGKEITYLKSHEFVLNIGMKDRDTFNYNMPLPKKYIEENLTDEERSKIKKFLNLHNETEYSFFQTAITDEK
jgi:hypothetical protein